MTHCRWNRQKKRRWQESSQQGGQEGGFTEEVAFEVGMTGCDFLYGCDTSGAGDDRKREQEGGGTLQGNAA